MRFAVLAEQSNVRQLCAGFGRSSGLRNKSRSTFSFHKLSLYPILNDLTLTNKLLILSGLKLFLTLTIFLALTACKTKMDYNKQPKIELHLHLDCSLSYEVVKQLKPSVTLEEYKESFIAPAKCTDLADYIKRAIKGFELMQTKEQLRLVTLDLFKQLKADNVL